MTSSTIRPQTPAIQAAASPPSSTMLRTSSPLFSAAPSVLPSTLPVAVLATLDEVVRYAGAMVADFGLKDQVAYLFAQAIREVSEPRLTLAPLCVMRP